MIQDRMPILPLVWYVGISGLLTALPALAADRYVSRLGDDASNDCSAAVAPCQRIGHAITQAAAGDTINVAAGTYRDSIRIEASTTLSFLGGWDAAFTARDPNATPTVIKSRRISLPGFTGRDRVWTIRADYWEFITVTIDGFVLRNGKASTNFAVTPTGYYRAGGGLGVQAYAHSAIVLAVRNTVVTRNRALDTTPGVYVNAVDDSTVDATFTDVRIHKNRSRYSIGGVYGSVAGYSGSAPASAMLTFQSCVVSENRGNDSAGGMYFANFGPEGSSLTIDVLASTITRNTAASPAALPPGSLTPGGGGIALADGLAPMTVNLIDSIVWGNVATGAGIGDDIYEFDAYPGSQVTLTATHSDIGEVALAGAVFTDLGGNLDLDPSFADMPHLAAGSPLIDAGSCAGTPPLDFEGDARPSGPTCDIGADEVVP